MAGVEATKSWLQVSFLLGMAGASRRLGRLGRGCFITARIILLRHMHIFMIKAGKEQISMQHDGSFANWSW